MIVVADTGPVNYLILSGHIDLLHRLYGSLLIPSAVRRELIHSRAPDSVRSWATTLPAWATVVALVTRPVSRNSALENAKLLLSPREECRLRPHG